MKIIEKTQTKLTILTKKGKKRYITVPPRGFSNGKHFNEDGSGTGLIKYLSDTEQYRFWRLFRIERDLRFYKNEDYVIKHLNKVRKAIMKELNLTDKDNYSEWFTEWDQYHGLRDWGEEIVLEDEKEEKI